MHGIIFSELKKYVETKHSPAVWGALLKESGLGSKMYMPIQTYPDAEVVALVTTASKMTGVPVNAILEDFGGFILPDLIQMYQALIKPEWDALNFIMHTEATIHTVVRHRNPGALPPALKCVRVSPGEVVLHYNSSRKMCGVAKGIARGVAKHYDQSITVAETTCMHRGDAGCLISIKRA
ncbi:MAG: heme NO-binding domain-containing protein [Chloroflexi bacterium]|nr:heme NO-binding domain-containing protein [Chloroflexota bacterium]